jgi:hypothetical protein
MHVDVADSSATEDNKITHLLKHQIHINLKILIEGAKIGIDKIQRSLV